MSAIRRNMKDFSGQIVVSLKGNDKGRFFAVLASGDGYVWYADGRRRRAEKPKKKKIKHIRVVCESGLTDVPGATNGQIRKAVFRARTAANQPSSYNI